MKPLFLSSVISIFSLMLNSAAVSAAEVQPGPQFSPREVVEIVLDALSENDTPSSDAGIELTFRFAAPSNRQVTGPIERFATMVKSEAYRDLINHERYQIGEIRQSDSRAFVPVVLSSNDGRTVAFMFRLGKQADEPYEGAWMTEAVYPVSVMELEESSGVSV